MSLMQLFFPVATITLSVACFACWKTNKPLREKAKEEARVAAEKAAKAVAEGREKDRRNNFRTELYGDLEQIIREPAYFLADHHYGSPTRHRTRWEELHNFILKVKNLRDQTDVIRGLEKRLDAQSQIIRNMQLNQRDIMKALQLGQPAE